MPLQQQLDILCFRDMIELKSPSDDSSVPSVEEQLTAQGYSILANNLSQPTRLISTLTLPTATRPATGQASFLGIPPEIRNEIYGLVLRYPEVGIRIANFRPYFNVASKKHVLTKTRAMHGAMGSLSWARRHEDFAPSNDDAPLLPSYPFETAIALLLVNKQVRNEAGPVFYGANRLQFSSLQEVIDFTKTREMKTFGQHFRQIVFPYDVLNRDLGHEAILELSKLTALESMCMSVDQTRFDHYKVYDKIDKYKGFKKLSLELRRGFHNLKTFQLGGTCDVAVQHFRTCLTARQQRLGQQRRNGEKVPKLTFSYGDDEVCLDSPCPGTGCTK